MVINENIAAIEWLLQCDEPSLNLRMLRELMDYEGDDPKVIHAMAAVVDSNPVRSLLSRMEPDGYWLQKNPRKQVFVGDGVEYGSFGSTHFCLSYLSELGLDKTHPEVDKAVLRYLSLQKSDGDWLGHYSCLYGYNIRTFIRLGYRQDERVQRAIDMMLTTNRQDGGYLCDFHEGKYKTRSVKSCIRGAVKCLMAFAELPEYWDHSRCIQLVDYFLNRGGIFQSTQPGAFVNKDMERFSFPIVWRANTWEVLYSLSKMGHGRDERLKSAWNVLDARADDQGRYVLDWTPTECPWKVGKMGEVNPWITFYVALAKKYRDESFIYA